jgi:sirohydrochlorin ferrochelatase
MNKNRIILLLILWNASTLAACQTGREPPVAARLLAPGPEARQELNAATATLLGVSSVDLAENTLIDSSQFAYARKPRRDASGQLLQGRVVEVPHSFRLEMRVQECWLVSQKTAQEVLLRQAKCVAYSKSAGK